MARQISFDRLRRLQAVWDPAPDPILVWARLKETLAKGKVKKGWQAWLKAYFRAQEAWEAWHDSTGTKEESNRLYEIARARQIAFNRLIVLQERWQSRVDAA